MLHDLKHAFRMLMQSKGWTLVVLLSLAIGIGATTALFTAVNGLLLQTVPLPRPESLVRPEAAGDNNMRRSSSDYGFSSRTKAATCASVLYAGYQAMRAANQTLTDLARIRAHRLDVQCDRQRRAGVATTHGVSGNFFSVLRVPMALGRPITDDDDRAGAEPVAVISHAFWRRRFGRDASIVGTSVRHEQHAGDDCRRPAGILHRAFMRLAAPRPRSRSRSPSTAVDLSSRPQVSA